MVSAMMTPEIQQRIIEQSSAKIARWSLPDALVSLKDIEDYTTFARRGQTVHDMIREPSFPRPVVVGFREKRWKSGEVRSWLNRLHQNQNF